MLTDDQIRRLLAPFDLALNGAQFGQLTHYLELLVRWNSKINLTAIESEADCVTRHFGESLCLARHAALNGSLFDIGSGAGFPGLALKIAFPELHVTLLEPVAKKRAFLKEVSRACKMDDVEVRSERLEDFTEAVAGGEIERYECATARAVGDLENLVPQAVKCLKADGRLYLWITRRQSETALRTGGQSVVWEPPIPLPLTRNGLICIGAVQ